MKWNKTIKCHKHNKLNKLPRPQELYFRNNKLKSIVNMLRVYNHYNMFNKKWGIIKNYTYLHKNDMSRSFLSPTKLHVYEILIFRQIKYNFIFNATLSNFNQAWNVKNWLHSLCHNNCQCCKQICFYMWIDGTFLTRLWYSGNFPEHD